MNTSINKELQALTKLPLTEEILHRLFIYNEVSGELRWRDKINSNQSPNQRAGRINSGRKYRDVSIGGKRYKEADIIWLYQTGEWPKELIEHKDNNTLNNSWNNLKEMSQERLQKRLAAIEKFTNTSGIPGLSWCNTRKMWRGIIYKHGKQLKQKRFKEREDAIAWINEFKNK